MAGKYEPFIEQYLKPEYWDGHSFGMGESTVREAGFTRNYVGVANAIEDYINTGRGRAHYPLQTIRTGESFDPQAFSPGTLFMQELEMLVTKSQTKIDFDSLHDVDLPYPATMIDRKYFTEGRLLRVEDADETMAYISSFAWGAVVDTRGGRNGIVSVPEFLLDINGRGGIKIPRYILKTAVTLPQRMGETDHRVKDRQWPRRRTEMISRTRWTEILCEGKLQKSGRFESVLASLRSLATGYSIVSGE